MLDENFDTRINYQNLKEEVETIECKLIIFTNAYRELY